MIVRANALKLPLPDGSVDLIVTSPPYFALRSYQDGGEHFEGQIGSEPTPQDFLEALWAATGEMIRVLKPSGSIFVNLGDKYAGSGGHNNSGISAKSTLSGNGHKGGGPKLKATCRSAPDRYNQSVTVRNIVDGSDVEVRAKSLVGLPWRYALGCIDHLGLILRDEIVWSKPNGLPESVTDRPRRSHEQWFHFTKQGRYFAAMDEIREAHAEKTLTHRGGGQAYGNDRNPDNQWGNPNGNARTPDPLGKLPGSVWTIPTEPLKVPPELDVDHFAAFPTEWPRRFVLAFSPSGICVKCGEGRRPVADRTVEYKSGSGRAGNIPEGAHAREGGRTDVRENHDIRLGPTTTTTIIGYACACTPHDAIDPPETRPAVVLDPFGGTGTTAMVARALGRVGVSVDLSADYCKLAKWRVYESDHDIKALARTFGGKEEKMKKRRALERGGQGTML